MSVSPRHPIPICPNASPRLSGSDVLTLHHILLHLLSVQGHWPPQAETRCMTEGSVACAGHVTMQHSVSVSTWTPESAENKHVSLKTCLKWERQWPRSQRSCL